MFSTVKGSLTNKAAKIAVALVAVVTLSSCGGGKLSQPPIDHFGYAVGTPLLTTNAATTLGASTNADIIGGRMFPAVFVKGPSGQFIPNRDIATAQVIPAPQQRVEYTINSTASYSDGVPVTCTDFLLAYKAGSLRGLFNSLVPLMEQVDRLECAPGEKKFSVVFKTDVGSRWRSLFGPGTVVPSHAIAHRVGMSEEQLVAALQSENSGALMPVAKVWREGFDLKHFDPELQVSAGPYKIASVADNGALQLVRNESFNGDVASIEKVMMWPRSANLAEVNQANSVEVADLIGVGEVSWVNRDDPNNRFTIERTPGHLTEQLTLGNAGVFASAPARQAFAACVDQNAVAAASSKAAGVEVPPVWTHLTSVADSINPQLEGVIAKHRHTDLAVAERLRGVTIRVGYLGPDERKKEMVAAIAASCAPAGITVVDASVENQSFEDIHRIQQTPSGVEVEVPGTIDALLHAADPNVGFGHINGDIGDVEKLRAEEQRLWDESDVIPLASQPRTLIYDKNVANIVVNTAQSGIGWNMERWQEGKKP
ncbi:ABC transporter substrate-binding protein [Corynebacterium epidermidicanis]|uniref:Extracellular solute-binding protein, family 5 n=1 Tax=Corynebacterium epidermidicanis TaxID=1050174 RepID=A0A0G3GWR6_9CORY|nr:ABC transporter substrate-binding protein [Corynebacterium epidermidicanis]AKK03272.1 extracellular solute-binding protein, family 5 [Corynebacterium epidermidicanis]